VISCNSPMVAPSGRSRRARHADVLEASVAAFPLVSDDCFRSPEIRLIRRFCLAIELSLPTDALQIGTNDVSRAKLERGGQPVRERSTLTLSPLEMSRINLDHGMALSRRRPSHDCSLQGAIGAPYVSAEQCHARAGGNKARL
jgi:hypothetical protein